jgi:hypothetical protein
MQRDEFFSCVVRGHVRPQINRWVLMCVLSSNMCVKFKCVCSCVLVNAHACVQPRAAQGGLLSCPVLQLIGDA